MNDPLALLLIVILVVGVLGAIPRWPYSAGWGYGPTYAVTVLLVLVVVLLLLTRTHWLIR